MSDTLRNLLSQTLRYWPTVLVSAIALLVGWFVWQRPIPPTWSLESELSVRTFGISRDGRLVTTEQELDSGKPIRLRIRDVRTGDIQRDFDLESSESTQSMRLTPDGMHAVVVDSGITLKVVSLEDGQPRFPARYARSIDQISPDSRYAIIDLDGGEVIDLENGNTIAKFEGESYFSEDSQQILIANFTQGVTHVSILDLRDNSTVDLGQVPERPEPGCDGVLRPGRYCRWMNGRLYVRYELKTTDELGFEFREWSFDTRSPQLTDPRSEPELFSRHEAHRTFLHSMNLNGHRGERRLHHPPPKGSLTERLVHGLNWLGVSTGPNVSEDSWQPIDDMTEKPIGSRVERLTPGFLISPDGEWLVDHHQETYRNGLRGWTLPAYRDAYRWLQSGAAALVPILLFYLGRWIRRTPAVRVPSTS